MIQFDNANIPKHLREKISLPFGIASFSTNRRIIIDTKAYWGVVNPYEIQNIIQSYRDYPISDTIFIFLITDSVESFYIPTNVRLYRTSLLKSTQRTNEHLLPYIWEGISTPFPPLDRTEKPIIGFCGLVSPYRIETLNIFTQDERCKTNYILRNEFWGGNPHNETIVNDFESNMCNSHFNICNRGKGNFSMRFYQTLSAGRIPILLNTDMVLPLEDKIDWKKYIVLANTEKELVENTIVFWNTRNIAIAQTKCREIYDAYFSGTLFLDSILTNI